MNYLIASLGILLLASVLVLSCKPAKKLYGDTISQLPPEDYFQKMNNKDSFLLIDIRTKLEYRGGHIPGAVNISLLSSSFKKQVRKLPAEKPVFIYCQTAHRSPFATRKLYRLGYREIYDLEKGFKAWKRSGMEIEK